MQRKLRLSFHDTTPHLCPRWWGGGGVQRASRVSYPPTVERESTTVKKHEAHTKTDTEQGGKEKQGGEQREEEVQLTRHRTLLQKREAVDTSGTLAVRDDTLWPSRRR